MSLLTVCQNLALNVGMAVPDQIVGSSRREWSEALQMVNECGLELARRVDWGATAENTLLVGDGTAFQFTLPLGFERMQRANAVVSGADVVRPLTRVEWNTLVDVEGAPRYFLLENRVLQLWPYLASGQTVTVNYQKKQWVDNAEGYTADGQIADLSEDLLTKALIVRWRRQKGMDYADFEAEYEAALADKANFDTAGRF